MRILVRPLLLAALAWGLLATPALAQLEGTYETIGPVPAPHSMDEVQIEEFLNFSCPHCNNFRTLSKPVLSKYGKRIRHINVPVLFRGQTDAPLRLYYVAEKLGRAEEIKELLFDATFRYGVNVYDANTVSYLARSAGLGDAFAAQANSDWVEGKIRQAHARADSVGVEATPTIILGGTLRLVPRTSMESFVSNFDSLVGQLLKAK